MGSEIILRPNQFCNLTEAVVRSEDDKPAIARKIRIATMLGTLQATLTDFPYLRKVWKKNTEEERLLGVSLTGIYDNFWTAKPTGEMLEEFKQIAVETNRELAERIGIPQSTAITCVKPSGTVSQLVNSASGIHPRHSQFYIRRVRQDLKDPLTQFMQEKGIPSEPCFMKPDSTVVFSFPQKSPDTAVVRNGVTALDHLENWLTYQKYWCEHKPSVTVSVKEDEWPSVGAYVWDNFDLMSGVSFLPHDGGTYKQAPYEECDEATYLALAEQMPKEINWDELVENEDNVEGVQTLACSAGICEI